MFTQHYAIESYLVHYNSLSEDLKNCMRRNCKALTLIYTLNILPLSCML